MPCLVWDSPQGRRVFDLDRAALIVGRDEVADVQLLEKSVSRRHALLQVDGAAVRLTDLGSRSGTRINGARLTPDLPSSLESGDFVQLGRITLTYHDQPPPRPREPRPAAPATPRPRAPAKAAAPKPRAAKPAASAAPPSPAPRWRMVALVLAFVVVAALGAVIALLATRGEEKPEPPPAELAAKTGAAATEEPASNGSGDGEAANTAPGDMEAPAEKPVDTDPPPLPEPPPRVVAPAGEMPPQGFVSPVDFPELLEVEYERYYPVRLVTTTDVRVEAIGSDDRLYRIDRGKVTQANDRLDLARRAARARAQLDPDDADGHLDLARWCAERFIRTETRALAARVLELRPNDPDATRLMKATE